MHVYSFMIHFLMLKNSIFVNLKHFEGKTNWLALFLFFFNKRFNYHNKLGDDAKNASNIILFNKDYLLLDRPTLPMQFHTKSMPLFLNKAQSISISLYFPIFLKVKHVKSERRKAFSYLVVLTFSVLKHILNIVTP